MAENTYEIKWHLFMNKTGRWKKEKNRLKEHILKIYMQTLIWDQRLNSQQLTLQLLKYMFHLLVKWKTTAMVCIWFGCAPIGSDVILIWACQVSYKKLVKWTRLRGVEPSRRWWILRSTTLGRLLLALDLECMSQEGDVLNQGHTVHLTSSHFACFLCISHHVVTHPQGGPSQKSNRQPPKLSK